MVPHEFLGVPLQPYPLYELVFDLALFGILWAARRREPLVDRPGLLFAVYLGAYSVGRFLLTYLRLEKVWFLGLQEAQMFSLIGFVGAALLHVAAWRGHRGPADERRGSGIAKTLNVTDGGRKAEVNCDSRHRPRSVDDE